MMSFVDFLKENVIRKVTAVVLTLALCLSSLTPAVVHAASLNLPLPGTMIGVSKAYMPVSVKGLMVHPENPFRFDFLVDSGDTGLKGESLKAESLRLAKYFLAALTVPENDMWVNLSPYEKNRIIPASFGNTQLGADVLAQDYILKQLSASLTYPGSELGKKFWDNVYAQVQQQYGDKTIPVNTFNKVWIMPSKARVYEHGNGAFVVESTLKVMLEEDYLALSKSNVIASLPAGRQGAKGDEAISNSIASKIVREIIIPALEKEVNEGSHFANLRQIFQTMILATWYKMRLKDSIIAKQYVDQAKTKGVGVNDKKINEKIYAQYLAAFKKGAYQYIKDTDSPNGKSANMPKKYISGGVSGVSAAMLSVSTVLLGADQASLAARGEQTMVEFAVAGAGKEDKALLASPDRREDGPSFKSPQMLWEAYQVAPNSASFLTALSPEEFARLYIYVTDLPQTAEVRAAIQVFRSFSSVQAGIIRPGDLAMITETMGAIKNDAVRDRYIRHLLSQSNLKPEVKEFLEAALARRQVIEKDVHKSLRMDDLNRSMQDAVGKYLKVFGWSSKNVQVLNKGIDIERLINEELADAEKESDPSKRTAMRLNDGNIWLRSNPNDVARDPKSTMVSTKNPNDAGLFNNWKQESELRPKLIDLMKKGASADDTVYVLPYLIGTVGDAGARIGLQITTSRQVALQIMTLYKVGIDAIRQLGDSDKFTKGVNVPGDLDAIYKKLADTKGLEDDRYFAAFVDSDEFLSYGSAYGGNAIFPKKFELRLGNWKFVKETINGGHARLTEHMFILQLVDKKSGEKHTVLGAFPAQGGKTGMGTIEVPENMNLEAWFLADDLVSIEATEQGWFAQPVEDGLFAVIYGTGPDDSPRLTRALKPNTAILYTNIARNVYTGEGWWEKKTKGFPIFNEANYRGWMDWKGDPIFARPVSDAEAQAKYSKNNTELTAEERWAIQVTKGVWAHKNSRASIPVENMDNLSPDFDNPEGTKVSIILAGGYNEFYPLLMIPFSVQAGIVDQFFNVALSTAATAGAEGELKEDGFAMRDFFASNEIAHLLAWLEVAEKTKNIMPLLAHINQKKKEWEGFGKNTILLDLMLRYLTAKTQEEKDRLFRKTAIGLIPRASALDIRGVINPATGKQLTQEELERLLTYDPQYWLNVELSRRRAYVARLEEK